VTVDVGTGMYRDGDPNRPDLLSAGPNAEGGWFPEADTQCSAAPEGQPRARRHKWPGPPRTKQIEAFRRGIDSVPPDDTSPG